MATPNPVQVTSFQATDCDQFAEAIGGWDHEYTQMSRGSFDGRLKLLEIGSTQVIQEVYKKKVRYRGTAPPGSFAFALPFQQESPGTYLGNPVASNTLILQAPGAEGELITSEFFDALVVSAPEADVRPIVAALSGGNSPPFIERGLLALSNDAANRLKRACLALLNGFDKPTADDVAMAPRNMDQLVKLVLWELVETSDDEPIEISHTRAAAIVRSATELVLSETSSVIGLTEICSQLGVSLRTLHYAFQDVTDTPPAIWLRQVRLNRVHKTLKAAAPNTEKIKRVATEHGFAHLGHFSGQYKRMFGQTPSETLRS